MQGTSRGNWLPDKHHQREQETCRIMLAIDKLFQTPDGKPDDAAWEKHLKKVKEYREATAE